MFSRLCPFNLLHKALCLLLSILITLQPVLLQVSANHFYGDIQEAVTGKEAHTALVQALTASGMGLEEANTYQRYVDNGVLVVTIGAGAVAGSRAAYQFTVNSSKATTLSAAERATLTTLEKRSAQTVTGNKPNITIRDHYAHHKEIVDDLKDQLEAMKIAQKEYAQSLENLIDFDMGRSIGNGYIAGAGLNGSNHKSTCHL